jgi:CRISPR/Cas system CMR subunit Cmr6 (Cas7 group RAMP superfamily)|tara:strand:+ start:559 stop:771 length:213 start_codon:yes stop_codon:yes gene_type:complete
VFLEEFSALTYLMSIMMMPKGFFIHTPLLLGVVLSLAVEFKKILDKNPNTPILSSSLVKGWVTKGSSVET